MVKSVNKVILLGNVGQDPEVKYTASGVPVAKVTHVPLGSCDSFGLRAGGRGTSGGSIPE
jgi:hypothetical protein